MLAAQATLIDAISLYDKKEKHNEQPEKRRTFSHSHGPRTLVGLCPASGIGTMLSSR